MGCIIRYQMASSGISCAADFGTLAWTLSGYGSWPVHCIWIQHVGQAGETGSGPPPRCPTIRLSPPVGIDEMTDARPRRWPHTAAQLCALTQSAIPGKTAAQDWTSNPGPGPPQSRTTIQLFHSTLACRKFKLILKHRATNFPKSTLTFWKLSR